MLRHPAAHMKMGQGTQERLSSTNTTVFYEKRKNWHRVVNFLAVKINFVFFIFYIYANPFFFLLKDLLIEYFFCIGYESSQRKNQN